MAIRDIIFKKKTNFQPASFDFKKNLSEKFVATDVK